MMQAKQVEQLVAQGSTLLRQNKVDEAKSHFEKAVELDENATRARGLLGLCMFRLGDFGGALPLYESLVASHPDDPSFHMNLGLVRLKLGNADGAIEALQLAKKLDPALKRISQYLGLSYARAGRYALAFRSFLDAGKDGLATEMGQHLSEKQIIKIRADHAAGRPSTLEESDGFAIIEEVPVETAVPQVPADDEDDDEEGGFGGRGPITQAVAAVVPLGQTEMMRAVAPPVPPQARPKDTETRPMFDNPPLQPAKEAPKAPSGAGDFEETIDTDKGHVPPPPLQSKRQENAEPSRPKRRSSQSLAGQGLTSFLNTHTRVFSDGPTFETREGELVIRIDGELIMRNHGIIATGGRLEYTPQQRFVRGATTDEILGGENEPMFRVTGAGWALVHRHKINMTALSLEDEDIYVVEAYLQAFGAELFWDCGNLLLSDDARRIVHLRGDGAVALRCRTALDVALVSDESPCYCDIEHFVGWTGKVFPQVVTPPAAVKSASTFVECTGEGAVIMRRSDV